MPRVLLTNDDGVDRDGIRTLRASLIDAGLQVTTVAPAGNASGVSRAVTIRRDVEVRRVEDGPNPVYACTGTPVDCVRVGLLSELVRDAAVVVSGINHGVNLGDDTAYSGTVGAAIEAALLGACGIAFSQQGDDHAVGLVERGSHAFPLAPVAARVVARASEAPLPGTALNVNLPSRLDRRAPLQVTRLGRRFYDRGWLTPRSWEAPDGVLRFKPYAGLTDQTPAHETGEDVDFTAVLAGRISVSPLYVDDLVKDGTTAWLQSLDLARLATEALTLLGPSAAAAHPAAS
jgi:5'-nucleotidase